MAVYERTNNRIGEAREAAGLTQQQLADYVNASVVSIFNWESGRQEPKASVLAAMSAVTGKSIEYLLGIDEPRAVKDIQGDDARLFGYWEQLNVMGRAKLLEHARMLSLMPENVSEKNRRVSSIAS